MFDLDKYIPRSNSAIKQTQIHSECLSMLMQCHPLPPPNLRTTTAMKHKKTKTFLRTTTAMQYQKLRMPMKLLIDSLRRSELQPVSGSGKKFGAGNDATQQKMRYLVIFHGS
jgi:hypothetical protein